jgi:hypothetical protein
VANISANAPAGYYGAPVNLGYPAAHRGIEGNTFGALGHNLEFGAARGAMRRLTFVVFAGGDTSDSDGNAPGRRPHIPLPEGDRICHCRRDALLPPRRSICISRTTTTPQGVWATPVIAENPFTWDQ